MEKLGNVKNKDGKMVAGAGIIDFGTPGCVDFVKNVTKSVDSACLLGLSSIVLGEKRLCSGQSLIFG